MEEKKLFLSNKWITFLFIYYSIIFTIGIMIAINIIIIKKTNINILNFALFGSIGMALTGNSIYYIRKLYKLCFNDQKLELPTEGYYKEKLATIIYFIARPFFSVGFAILVIIGFKSGFMATSIKEVQLHEGFIYLTMFISFFIGFLTNKFIKKLEDDSSKMIDIISTKNGE